MSVIRRLRHAMGLTQAELAERVGVSRVTLARWEIKAHRPSPIAIRSLRTVKREWEEGKEGKPSAPAPPITRKSLEPSSAPTDSPSPSPGAVPGSA